MSKQSSQKKNPLNMYELYEGGPFVLPATLCSQRRAEFLRRANDILGFYSVITITSKQGSDVIFEAEQKGKFQDSTPFRLKAESGGIVAQLNYGLFKKLFANAGGHLTNQAFLMLYGNLEAFLADLVLDALTESSGVDDAYQETLNLMVLAKWRGKIDRISQKLKLGLGKHRFVKKFKDIDMGFLGDPCEDPLEFLEKAGDLRHRLVHSSGRADAALVAAYPNAGLSIGDGITLSFALPYSLQFFFAHLSDLFDEAFASSFGWNRTSFAPEILTE